MQLLGKVTKEMLEALADDLNTPRLLGIIFENARDIRMSRELRMLVRGLLQKVGGLTLVPLTEVEITMTAEIKQLVAQREQARKEKNWKRADALRDKLQKLGYHAQDKKAC